MPLEDRAADTWEPLIAIADLAAGGWPQRARTAATSMVAAESPQEEDGTASVRLLADLRDLFDQAGAEALYTSTILERLHKLDDAPWADWYGHPLATRDLAKLLRPYGVGPKDVREHGTGPQRKGYTRSDLYEPWTRYLPRHARPEGKTPGQADRGPVADHESAAATSATTPGSVADVAAAPAASATATTCTNAHVADVAAHPRSGHDGWTFNQPLVPCVVCGTDTSNRSPSGRPLHLGCAAGAEEPL